MKLKVKVMKQTITYQFSRQYRNNCKNILKYNLVMIFNYFIILHQPPHHQFYPTSTNIIKYIIDDV